MSVRIKTTNYDDFNRAVSTMFGGGFKLFFGTRQKPEPQFEAYATDGIAMIKYYSKSGMPESFSQEYAGKQPMPVSDMDSFEVS